MSASSADGKLVVVVRHRHYKRISPGDPAQRCRRPQHAILRRENFERRVVEVFDEGQTAAGIPGIRDTARHIDRARTMRSPATSLPTRRNGFDGVERMVNGCNLPRHGSRRGQINAGNRRTRRIRPKRHSDKLSPVMSKHRTVTSPKPWRPPAGTVEIEPSASHVGGDFVAPPLECEAVVADAIREGQHREHSRIQRVRQLARRTSEGTHAIEGPSRSFDAEGADAAANLGRSSSSQRRL
jgi:hypothetical protein